MLHKPRCFQGHEQNFPADGNRYVVLQMVADDAEIGYWQFDKVRFKGRLRQDTVDCWFFQELYLFIIILSGSSQSVWTREK